MGYIGLTDLTDPPRIGAFHSQETLRSTDKPVQRCNGKADSHGFRLMHRLAVFAAAVMCILISLESLSTAIVILRGQISRNLPLQTYTANLITRYAGTTTIKESPLVHQVLEGSTSPRNFSVYLETPSAQSHTGCSNVPNFNRVVYSNDFLRFIFSRMQTYAAYNLSYVAEMELVVPVIDCTFDFLVLGYPTVLKAYYLVRNKTNPEEVLLLSTSLSAQDYQVAQQFQKGAATILLVAAINETQATTVKHHIAVALNYPYVAEPEFAYSELEGTDGDNYWLLKTLPNQRNLDPAKAVRIASRFGRYKSDPTAQSNIETAHWDLPSDAATELREWRWFSRAVLHDSWAWTHTVHGVFAVYDIFNLSVLTFIIYRRLRMGHVWVGDAFATVSNSLLYRGLIVIFCSHLNGYWTITKMCISIGDSITDQHVIYYRPELVRADLLSVYLNLASVLSYLARERVDPLVAYLTFEFGWTFRLRLANLFPTLAKHIADFAIADITSGLLDVGSGLGNLSPMEVMTAYALKSDRKPVVFSAVVSICSPIVFMLAYILGRKSTRYATDPVTATGDRDTMAARRRSSAYRTGLQNLTSFELATGAALTNRFGVISSYDNYEVQDTQLNATIDAVYCNGFLVINGKFLIGAQDLLPLVIMKVTRVRFTNIFVHEMEKNTVKETSMLVYPATIAWSDLLHLDVTTLA